MPNRSEDSPRVQFSSRTMLLVVLSALVGLGTGLLLWLAAVGVAQAVLGAVGTAATALLYFDKIVE